VRGRVEAFNEAATVFIEKVRKERSTSLDLKRLVGDVSLIDADGHHGSPEVLLRFPIFMSPAEGSVKPDEVVRGILGRPVEGASFIRERLHFAPSAPPAAGPLAPSMAKARLSPPID